MIETKEQYAGIETIIEILRLRADKEMLSSPGEQSLSVLIGMKETIEILRKVVKAGVAYKDTLARFGREPEGIYHVGDELLLDDWTEALAALPEWIKEEDLA